MTLEIVDSTLQDGGSFTLEYHAMILPECEEQLCNQVEVFDQSGALIDVSDDPTTTLLDDATCICRQ